MVAELSFIEEWIPEQMEPGTLFVLESAGDMGEAQNPYWAVLACPSCGCLGLITRGQYAGLESMICGADSCSAEYFLRDGVIGYRKPTLIVAVTSIERLVSGSWETPEPQCLFTILRFRDKQTCVLPTPPNVISVQ